MSTYSLEALTFDDHPDYHTEEGCKSKWCQWKRLAIIAVVVLAVVALALGLGLGLGLSSGDDAEPASGCLVFQYESLQDASKSSSSDNRQVRWDGQCPDLGQPKCPDGVDPPLLLVSLDGFRAEYLQRGLTPVLQKLNACGVHAQAMRGVFPTQTFPNHYSIVTGLYPESHGIISNNMYDFDFKEMFTKDARYNSRWWGGQPIWNTVTQNGGTAFTFFWPGSDSAINDTYPTRCVQYDSDVPFEMRVDEVLRWLGADDPPNFVATYFEEPDWEGHEVGPYGEELTPTLQMMDDILQRLMDGLVDIKMDKCVNLMIVADHGMNEAECKRVAYLDSHLDVDNYYLYAGMTGRLTSRYIRDGDEILEQEDGASADETLDKLECLNYNNTKDWYLQFFKKEDLPKRYHYANNDRIDEIVIDVELDWRVLRDRAEECAEGGDHGYDNTFYSMLAIFTAFGPAFKQDVTIDVFDSIELYNLMTELLDVPAAPNNGTEGRLNLVLHSPTRHPLTPVPSAEYLCLYPEEKHERDVRRNATDCYCNLEDLTSKDVEVVDAQLNLTAEETDKSVARHLPLGRPDLQREDVTLCQLTQTDYITGFSHEHQIPLWTAFAMANLTGGSVYEDMVRGGQDESRCVRADVRLETDVSPQCSHMVDDSLNMTYVFMYQPGLSEDSDVRLDAHISSNIVPMFRGFRDGIWQEAMTVLTEYSTKYKEIHVLAGPVFDYNHDGHYDELQDIKLFLKDSSIPVPSHYFLVASRCPVAAKSCLEDSVVLSVILPHRPHLDNCKERDTFKYLQHNMARVRDVELLTGLHLLTDVPVDSRLLMQTGTPVGLWERSSWMDLVEDACPGTLDAQCPPGYDQSKPPVLLISVDGFHPDYLHLKDTPVLQRLYDCGSHAQHMRSVYPTLTFPNHYTIVTGLYPESHGIIDNSMYDTNLSEYFSLGGDEKMNNHWWGGEPIWNTVEEEGGTSMLFMWPGSDVDIQGKRPTKWLLYDGDIPDLLRVDTILEWLNGSEGVNPDFMTLYFSRVDEAGHEGGPASLWVQKALRLLDESIKRLMDGLYRMNMHQCLNIIITSDHGMTDISCDRSVQIADYLDEETNENTYLYPGGAGRISNQYKYDGGIVPVEEEERVPVEKIVQDLECRNANMSVYDKADLPKRLHYAFNHRIDDIPTVLADTWQVADKYPWCPIRGQHGWDPSFTTMQAFFLAYGPSFQTEYETLPFENLELYNIMAHLLSVSPVPNNGTSGVLYDILKTPPLPPLDGDDDYIDNAYPNPEEYAIRANLTGTGCQCQTPENSTTVIKIKDYDEQLNLTRDEINQAVDEHLPYGKPRFRTEDTLSILYQRDYITGYDYNLQLPVWTAYTVVNDQISEQPVADCLRPDVRMEGEDQPVCSDYDNLQDDLADAQLFPPEFSFEEDATLDALLLSNTVPMYKGFYEESSGGVWHGLKDYIARLAAQYQTVHVVMGPVFDYNADGRRDDNITSSEDELSIPIPSHYYTILLKCSADDCATNMDYDAMSFVLPHKPDIMNCMDISTYLQQNLARIRDIELLTDLVFLTPENQNTQEAIYSRTFLPFYLWPVSQK